jgi:hypothetical protein
MIAILYIIALLSVAWSINWELKMAFANLIWIDKWLRAMDINFWVQAAEHSEILVEQAVARELLVVYGAA